MPGQSYENVNSRLARVSRCYLPHCRLLPRDDPALLEGILDTYEQEELQRLNDELQERKRILEERLAELNNRLKELEELKNRLELERRQLAAYCDSMELHVVRLEGELRDAMAEADRLQLSSVARTAAAESDNSDSESDNEDSDNDSNNEENSITSDVSDVSVDSESTDDFDQESGD